MNLDELRTRLDDPELAILDVRSARRVRGRGGLPVRPAAGPHPRRAAPRPVQMLERGGAGLAPDELRASSDSPEGAEVVCYCHSGSRSGMAAAILRGAGYDASNYVGSWHEWSRDPDELATES